jgi:radical SAM superfamily enzyme YgiQ (UPF0313 family)
MTAAISIYDEEVKTMKAIKTEGQMFGNEGSGPGGTKILLAFLPYWTPYLPPQGITTLKAYLTKHGYDVKTVDPNMAVEFRLLYEKYFDNMKEFIPYSKRGNFYNIGHDVLYNHMMAHLHRDDEQEHIELVRVIIHKTYYCELTDAQVARLNGVLVEFFDALEEYLVAALEREKPGVFGSTAYYGTLPASLFAFKMIKERYPHIKTAVGGGSFADHLMKGSPNYQRFLEQTAGYIDKIFIGQGQILFLKWLRGELDDSQRVYTLQDIGGQTTDIDSDCDVPDLSDLKPSEYIFMGAAGSRSCPYECGFCNVKNFWGKHRLKDVRQTVNEMIMQYKKYGLQLFFMYDALLNQYITDFAREFIKSDESLYFVGYLKACEEGCDINNTMLWRRGGFYRARLGVESGSQRVLDLIDKRITVEQIRGTITSLAYAGIKTTTYWLIGYPGETEEDFQQTLDIVEELRNDIWESECNPFNYFYSGQQREGDWASRRRLLYPEAAADKLITQTWTLDIEPTREEVYRRMNRFVQHCDKLGIPNPYSIQDIYKADARWKKLHKNAVPSIAELRDTSIYVQECKQIREVSLAKSAAVDAGDFDL